jgi:hypothetical protein
MELMFRLPFDNPENGDFLKRSIPYIPIRLQNLQARSALECGRLLPP